MRLHAHREHELRWAVILQFAQDALGQRRIGDERADPRRVLKFLSRDEMVDPDLVQRLAAVPEAGIVRMDRNGAVAVADQRARQARQRVVDEFEIRILDPGQEFQRQAGQHLELRAYRAAGISRHGELAADAVLGERAEIRQRSRGIPRIRSGSKNDSLSTTTMSGNASGSTACIASRIADARSASMRVAAVCPAGGRGPGESSQRYSSRVGSSPARASVFAGDQGSKPSAA